MSASEMTYIVSGGALNSTNSTYQSDVMRFWYNQYKKVTKYE